MTDRQLEERLRAWYAAEVGESERAPEDLRASLAAIPATKPTPLRLLTRRRNFTLLAVAAVLLVGGGVAVGAGLLRLKAVVPPTPSEALLATPVPSPSATPTETASPTVPPKAWITGRELTDVLSADFGYTWSEYSLGEGKSSFDSASPMGGSPVNIRVFSPIDSPANVHVSASLDVDADDVSLHAGRVAQALAPDAWPWIRDAFTQGLDTTGGSSAATDTTNGGSVGVSFVDEPILSDWMFVWFSPEPLPKPRTEPIGSGGVVYADSGLIRVVNQDGADDGALLINDWRVPDSWNASRVLGWTPDGSRLIYLDGDGVMSTDATGSEPTLIARLCATVPVGDDCGVNLDEIVLSPDGTRLAFPMGDDRLDAIGFFDVASGQLSRVQLDADTGPACDGPFGGGPMQWSPDGTRLVFGTSVGPRVGGWCQGAVFTVDADGTHLRRVTPSNVYAMDPRWSADGSTILLSTSTPHSAWDRKGDATRIPIDMDIYSVRPDGSGLTALTGDHVSIEPFATRDGRIVYSRWIQADGRHQLWVMDADGENATQLDPTIPALTAAGCTACPFPDELRQPETSEGERSDGLLFWRPGQP